MLSFKSVSQTASSVMVSLKAQIEVNSRAFHMYFSTTRFMNYQVYTDDHVVMAFTGVAANVPMAICQYLTGDIIVNEAFKGIPKEYQDAILAHEVGHIKMGMRGNKKSLYNLLWKLDVEIRADLYSLHAGYDIIGALAYIRDRVEIDSLKRSLQSRIDFLVEYL